MADDDFYKIPVSVQIILINKNKEVLLLKRTILVLEMDNMVL